jgi:hypothetical protein
MKVGEFVDAIENTIFVKFQHPMSCSFYDTGA